MGLNQISAQHVLSFPRYESVGLSARAHLRTCKHIPSMTRAICINAWSLTTHQIWLQSAKPFLSYSLATHFDTLHEARTTCQAEPPNESNPAAVIF